jgi:hypothetical protein
LWLKRCTAIRCCGTESGQTTLIRQRDGSVRSFDRMHVMGQMYLAQVDDALGRPRSSSDVLDALEGATPASRRAVEEMSSGGFFADLKPRDATEAAPEDLSEQAR